MTFAARYTWETYRARYSRDLLTRVTPYFNRAQGLSTMYASPQTSATCPVEKRRCAWLSKHSRHAWALKHFGHGWRFSHSRCAWLSRHSRREWELKTSVEVIFETLPEHCTLHSWHSRHARDLRTPLSLHCTLHSKHSGRAWLSRQALRIVRYSGDYAAHCTRISACELWIIWHAEVLPHCHASIS